MIHSKIFPSHRAYSSLCLLNKDYVCLYGGYRGGAKQHQKYVYDDIWILNLQNLKTIEYKKRNYIKKCGYSLCNNTEHDMELFKCSGINISDNNKCDSFYCSKYCQKRDWIQHRIYCQRQIF